MDLYGEVGGVEGTACGWAAVPTIVPSTARRRTSAKMPAPPTRSSAPSAAAVPIKMSIAFRPASLSGRSRTAKRVRGSAASALVARPPPAAIAVKSVADHAAPTSASFLRGVKNEYNPRHPNDYSAYVEAKSNERKRQKMERQLSDDAERRRRQAEERKRRGVEGALADVRGMATGPAGGARLRGFGGGGGGSRGGARGGGAFGRGRGATVPAWMQKRLEEEERAPPLHRAGLGRGAAPAAPAAAAPSSAFAAAAAAAAAAIANALRSSA